MRIKAQNDKKNKKWLVFEKLKSLYKKPNKLSELTTEESDNTLKKG